MTIREELEKLGPEAVRRAMVAFEHRADGTGFQYTTCSAPGWCCFLAHAGESGEPHEMFFGWSAIEDNFEEWSGATVGREGLRAECIQFLAEHGNAPEVVVSGVGQEVPQS